MRLQSNKKFRELQDYENALNEVKFRCKCGHRTVIPKCAEKQICGWCGKYVFRDKKVEFEYRVKEKLKK